MAARFYGDASFYPLIATVNGIANPDVINVGQVLVIFVGRSDGFGLRSWTATRTTLACGTTDSRPTRSAGIPASTSCFRMTTAPADAPIPSSTCSTAAPTDFRQFDFLGIRNLTAGKPIIVVMPDGGHAGWYSNPVSSFVGPRNWETFHIAQLLPWIEANFRTFAEYDGRAVGGFSMGGFGALKYAAKYYGHFASVSAHSGPASLRRDFGLVVHWANITSAVLDLGGGTVYGAPSGTRPGSAPTTRSSGSRATGTSGSSWSPAPVRTRSTGSTACNETQVLAGQREFRERLSAAGIPHESHEVPGGHVFRPDMFVLDLDGIIARLRPASSAASGSAAHPGPDVAPD